MLSQIREQFESDSQVRMMRIQQRNLQMSGDFVAALSIGKKIENLFSSVVNSYIEEAERSFERIDIGAVKLPENDRKEIEELSVTMFMACDIIETCIMDMDDVLHRTDKNLHVDMFDDIIEIKKRTKEKLKFLSHNSKYMKDIIWADKCDDMFEMLKNKARSIIRKRIENKKKEEL